MRVAQYVANATKIDQILLFLNQLTVLVQNLTLRVVKCVVHVIEKKKYIFTSIKDESHEIDNNKVCKICFERVINTRIPCGHICMVY